jgi:hypothetical protein
MYWADGGRQFFVQAFLNRVLGPLRLDEAASAATVKAALVMAKVVGTC